MNQAQTQAVVAAPHVFQALNVTRYIQANGFEINALQGAYMIIGSGVSGADEVRVAKVIGGNRSESGRTIRPALIERGWVPGFRADQLPHPSDPLLEGKGEFIVFPVTGSGWSDHLAEIIQVTDYTLAWNSWYRFREDRDPVDPTEALRANGLNDDVIRLARNVTRAWPGSGLGGAHWTFQEAIDLMTHHGAWVVEDQFDRMIMYCPERAVVINLPGGLEFPHDGCTAYGLCSTFVEGEGLSEGMSISELFLHPTEEAGWTETLHIKVWRGSSWAIFPVEGLMLRTGSPFPGPGLWPTWTESNGGEVA